ncbi:MAG: HD domain-containing protein [Candidatus Gracilibacteria bacterium]|nr:HD domain-containing protein [Candidatus Gracilibacteria bacterium]
MIGTILNVMLTRGLTMRRWNNFPRIENVSHLDNVGFVMHIALFLTFLEEKEGYKVNKEFLLKRILFSSLNRLVLSDINSGTKEYIMSMNKDIFAQLEEKAIEKIFELDAPEYIKEDIQNTIDNTEFKQEILIIEAAKKFASQRECIINARVFSEVYDKTLHIINGELDVLREKVPSLDILMDNESYITYLSHIRGLSHSMRWNQHQRRFPVSVMSHLVYVTFINYIIAQFERKAGNEIHMENILLRSVYHDIPEAITGDIITPTKRAIPEFVDVLEQAERNMMDDYLFDYLPDSYKSEVEELIFAPFDGEIGKIAKYGDIFSALFEAKIEINSGNQGFLDIYQTIKKQTNTFDLTGTDYLLTHGIDAFDEEKKLVL